MRIALLPIPAVAILLAASAAAQQPPAERAQDEPAKMICKKFKATGTRLGNRRVCASAGDWAQREAEDQATLRGFRGRLDGETTKTPQQLENALARSLRGI